MLLLDTRPAFVKQTRTIERATCVNRQRYSSYVKKLRSYFEIPAFSVANTWRGASEIVHRFDYDLSAISILNHFPLEQPSGANFCPVLSWLVDEVFYRYKIWENVGEILWLPLYAGQKITGDSFHIEIWNVNPSSGILTAEDGSILTTEAGQGIQADGNVNVTTELTEAIRFYTSRLILPSSMCDDEDTLLADPTDCVDPVYELENFQPLFGDYYTLVAPCERQLIKGAFVKPAAGYNILQSTDDTWHLVAFAENEDGDLVLRVDQNNTVPPADALGYFPMYRLTSQEIYKIALRVMPDEGATTHALAIRERMADDTEDPANVIVLTNEVDGLDYGFYLNPSGTNFTIYPETIVL